MANYDPNLLQKFRKQPNRIQQTARELRDLIDQQHAIRVGELLGCSVTVLRRVPLAKFNRQGLVRIIGYLAGRMNKLSGMHDKGGE